MLFADYSILSHVILYIYANPVITVNQICSGMDCYNQIYGHDPVNLCQLVVHNITKCKGYNIVQCSISLF